MKENHRGKGAEYSTYLPKVILVHAITEWLTLKCVLNRLVALSWPSWVPSACSLPLSRPPSLPLAPPRSMASLALSCPPSLPVAPPRSMASLPLPVFFSLSWHRLTNAQDCDSESVLELSLLLLDILVATVFPDWAGHPHLPTFLNAWSNLAYPHGRHADPETGSTPQNTSLVWSLDPGSLAVWIKCFQNHCQGNGSHLRSLPSIRDPGPAIWGPPRGVGEQPIQPPFLTFNHCSNRQGL